MNRLFRLLLLALLGIVTTTPTCIAAAGIPVYGYKIVNTYPHDRAAFTQGLAFENGYLYEGTGRLGQSSLRRVELKTGKVVRLLRLSPRVFGEGIALYGNRIIQATWKSQVAFVFDKDSFQFLKVLRYSTEGWGLTYDGEHIIMSDGTPTLHFYDPSTFQEVRAFEVRDDKGPVAMLNELEYVNGEIYANVWLTERIARIDARTGQIVGWIDLSGLLSAAEQTEAVDVLNGIAYDAANKRLFVTGKLWPKLFEIELIPPR